MSKKQEKRVDRRTFGSLVGIGLGAAAVSCASEAGRAAASETPDPTDVPVVVSSVHVVHTIGDLRKIAAPHHRQVALVIQYSARSGRGGGLFVFDAESDERASAGHVVTPASGKGRWSRMA